MRRAHATLAILCGLLAGCATPVPGEALPAEPIAFLYRTLAQGRDRADRLASMKGERQDPGRVGQGVMKLNEVDDLVDRIRGVRRELPADLQGRIAFYHPHTREIEELESFGPGALPLAWSPDRTKLLVANRLHGKPRLFQYSTVRRDVAPSTTGHEAQLGGDFGPDGSLVYSVARRLGAGIELTVWVTEPGGEERQLSTGPQDTGARWSPDGKVVLYQATLRNGRSALKAIDMEDPLAEPRVIARGREPAFSPRGDWVVYSRERDGGWRLWRMRPDGTGKTALGYRPQGEADERHATVSPDGRWVVYVAESEDRQRIRIRGMDGSGDRLLIEDADGTSPVW